MVMNLVLLFSARHAAINRLARRVDHGTYKDRCVWKNGHQFRWAERLSMKAVQLLDDRQDRLYRRTGGKR